MRSIHLKVRFISYSFTLFIKINILIQGLLESRESTIDANIKFIEEEIEIRIESVKINLEELFEKLKKDLIGIKKEMIE